MQPETSEVEVRRSARRKKSVSAHREGHRVIVAIPAHFTKSQEREWVDRMVAKLANKDRKRRPSDAALLERARQLSAQYLGGRARPNSVRWVTNQNSRWGSCTIAEADIRLSHRLESMPPWVIDYVLLHELTHLLHANHGDQFWRALAAYPRTERARGFLDGVAWAEHQEQSGC